MELGAQEQVDQGGRWSHSLLARRHVRVRREEQGGRQGGDKTNGTLQLINCASVSTCSHAKQSTVGFYNRARVR